MNKRRSKSKPKRRDDQVGRSTYLTVLSPVDVVKSSLLNANLAQASAGQMIKGTKISAFYTRPGMETANIQDLKGKDCREVNKVLSRYAGRPIKVNAIDAQLNQRSNMLLFPKGVLSIREKRERLTGFLSVFNTILVAICTLLWIIPATAPLMWTYASFIAFIGFIRTGDFMPLGDNISWFLELTRVMTIISGVLIVAKNCWKMITEDQTLIRQLQGQFDMAKDYGETTTRKIEEHLGGSRTAQAIITRHISDGLNSTDAPVGVYDYRERFCEQNNFEVSSKRQET